MADEQNTHEGGEDKGASEHINLKVVSQDGSEVYFKIKKTTQLRKLMDAYCSRQAINPNSIRFLFDGQRVREDQTPKELGMEDNDVIDAVLQQTVRNSSNIYSDYRTQLTRSIGQGGH